MMVLTKSGRIMLYAIPVALIGGVLLWPVIAVRLSGFAKRPQLPSSWVVRLQNLRGYFWPTLFSDWNWILGVRPAARVGTPNQQYGYVWIESGYTWLLWGGGLPLLGSYLAFASAVLRKAFGYARRADTAGIVGFAIAAAITSQVVMMIFDPHLTYRGSGDAIFLILALLRKFPSRRAPTPAASGGTDITIMGIQNISNSRHTGRIDHRPYVANASHKCQDGREPGSVATLLSRGHLQPGPRKRLVRSYSWRGVIHIRKIAIPGLNVREVCSVTPIRWAGPR